MRKGPEFVRFIKPIVDILKSTNGTGKAGEIVTQVIDQLEITAEELSVTNKNGGSRIKNQIHWARQYLVAYGAIDNSVRGIWTLTPQGQELSVDSDDVALEIFNSVQNKRRESAVEEIDDVNAPEDKNSTHHMDPSTYLLTWNPQSVTNLILYGPPGTGKTYRTMAEAVRLCDGEAPSNRAELTTRYRALQKDNRIAFVTFHQSFGYEEFVEGIRPVLGSTESDAPKDTTVQFECPDGVFKRMCSLARGATAAKTAFQGQNIEDVRVWKMSLGNTTKPNEGFLYQDCIDNGYILLGYGLGLNLEGCRNRDAVLARLRQEKPDLGTNDYNVTSTNVFINKMATNDLVVISDGNLKFRAIGQITGNARYRESDDDLGEYRQLRTVKWLATFEPSLPMEKLLTVRFSQATIYELKRSVIKEGALQELLSGDDDTAPKNHVLIIDEINRGNIAKILGELITLIEPDKRLGMPNEIRVTLPYSGDEFGVPANLHIIGTMNTADRSIAFLDTALRRRFRFQAVMPDSGVVRDLVGTNGVLDGFDVAHLLDTLNTRIEILYDRDHTLGHSFFLNATSLAELRTALQEKIIPLLEEYFYGDWCKICMVLGCPYDAETGKLLGNGSNPTPLIQAKLIKASDLPGGKESDYEDRIQFRINDAFEKALPGELKPFFQAILA